MSFRTKVMLFLCLMLWAAVPTWAQRDTTTQGLIDAMKETQGLSHFAALVEDLGLAEGYNNGVYTAFAPDDATSDAMLLDLGYTALDDMSEVDRQTLALIVAYHFLPGAYDEAALDDLQQAVDGPIQLASALPGATLTYDNGNLDDVSRIIQFDLPGGSGVIHLIDNYLIPTQDSFERSIDVLSNDTNLTQAQTAQATLADTLRDADDFSMMAEGLEQVGLMNDLDGDGPYTLFVMSNDTLTRVLSEAGLVWEDLLADDESLTNLLLYHIVPGQYSSAALNEYDNTFVGTMLAQKVVIMSVDRGEISVNQIPLLSTDAMASNGIIHVIDGVLLPPLNQ